MIVSEAGVRRFETEREYLEGFVRRDQVDRYLTDGHDFIPEAAIERLITLQPPPAAGRVRAILAKSLAIETLLPEETAELLRVNDAALLEEMVDAAWRVKHAVYDNRIVTFAPLYIGNPCLNRCQYCGFNCENGRQQRSRLEMPDIRKECEVLAGRIGHKRLIMDCGEHPSTSTDYLAEALGTVYGTVVPTRKGTGQIRRVNLNVAPMPIEDLRHLKTFGIGTFQVFQETYHRATYRRLHPGHTPKSDYDWRLTCMHRALEAGVDDVGIGVLFGLHDWRFEVLALVCHARELERVFKIGPHTISFPRLRPASAAPVTTESPWLLSDEHFLRALTVLRLSVPYTGMIVTAREPAHIRREAVRRGCTQMDASSRVGIGAYSRPSENQVRDRQQFMLGDTRSLEELICDLARDGMITSFCTAGYRCGRTGGCIMDALKTGREGKCCKVNAVLTFREWLDDFASSEAYRLCEPLLRKELAEIERTLPKFYPAVKEAYDKIEAGARDLFF